MGLFDRLRNAAPVASRGVVVKTEASEHEAMRLLDEGVVNEAAGRLREALENYNSAIRLKPDFGRAHFNRGNVLLEQGELHGALDAYTNALNSKPDSAATYFNMGNVYTRQGETEAAVIAYQKAIALKPDFADAHVALGAAFQDMGRGDEAMASYHQALAIRPSYAEAHYNLGMALVETGMPEKAVTRFRHALEINPDYAQAHLSLGATLQEMGQFEAAIASYQRAIKIGANTAELHNNLGVAQKNLGQLDESLASHRLALALRPDFAEAYCNLGAVLHQRGEIVEAMESYRKSIEINPKGFDAHNNLGVAQHQIGHFNAAVVSYRRALEINPDFSESQNNLGSVLAEAGDLESAANSFRRALEKKPDFARAHSNLLFIHNYLADQTSAELLAEAKRYGNSVAQLAKVYSSWNNTPDPMRCLRVGIVSGDLRAHPVGFFAESVLGALSAQFPGRLELFAYSNYFQFDETSERIKACCRGWHSALGISDDILAQRIREDDIDILVDLSGHTGHNRLPLFAWKPAPVQVSWLGYFATTGVEAIDYLIADPLTLLESEEANFTETIWRLPETRLCFTPPNVTIDVGPLPANGKGYVTFGCFNHLTKMNDGVFALWSRILSAVPNSKLFLKNHQLNEQSSQQKVINILAAHGIDHGRLILETYAPRADYLAAYNQVDIALDPFPYTGGTTTVEALWMGVPVLTLAGKQFLARQGVGLLMNAGLPEWVATDQNDYFARAVSHANNLDRLASLRAVLRQQVLASPIFDAPRFARHFEAALRGMWKKWCDDQGASPSEQTPPLSSAK